MMSGGLNGLSSMSQSVKNLLAPPDPNASALPEIEFSGSHTHLSARIRTASRVRVRARGIPRRDNASVRKDRTDICASGPKQI